MYKFLTALTLTVSLAASAQAGFFRTRIVVRESRPVATPVRGILSLAVDFLRTRAAVRAEVSRSRSVTRGTVPAVTVVVDGIKMSPRAAAEHKAAVAAANRLTPGDLRRLKAAGLDFPKLIALILKYGPQILQIILDILNS